MPLWHEGKERRFGPFTSKTEARSFYEERKKEQRDGRLFPDRYQKNTAELIQTILDDYLATTDGKQTENHAWCTWLKKQRKSSDDKWRVLWNPLSCFPAHATDDGP